MLWDGKILFESTKYGLFLCFWKDSLKKTFKFAEVLCAAGWKVLNRPVTPLGILIFSLSKVGGVMNPMEENQYQSPAIQALELYSEGVLCSSTGTESLEENDGSW